MQGKRNGRGVPCGSGAVGVPRGAMALSAARATVLGWGRIGEGWDVAAQGAVVVVVDGVADQAAQLVAVPHRVDAAPAHELAHVALELRHDVHRCPLRPSLRPRA